MAQWKCSPIGWPVILVHSHTGEVKDRQKLWNWHFIPTNHKGKKRMVLLIGHPGEPPFWQHWFASPLCCMHGSSSLAFPWSPLLSPTNCISYQIPKRLSGRGVWDPIIPLHLSCHISHQMDIPFDSSLCKLHTAAIRRCGCDARVKTNMWVP